MIDWYRVWHEYIPYPQAFWQDAAETCVNGVHDFYWYVTENVKSSSRDIWRRVGVHVAGRQQGAAWKQVEVRSRLM